MIFLKSVKLIVVLCLTCFTFAVETAAQKALNQLFLSGDEAAIENSKSSSVITLLVIQPERFVDANGQMLISVEIPKRFEKVKSDLKTFQWTPQISEKSRITPLAVSAKATELRGVTMPPGPNQETAWQTFSVDLKDAHNYTNGPVYVLIPLENASNLTFARVLLGKPSTNRSKMIGAFAPSDNKLKKGKMIESGVDYLGTETAAQHFRIPANSLAPDTEAFDELVEFGDLPFEPEKNNIDTVMLRLRNIHPGETTPIRLLRFANRSKKPIAIKSKNGNLLFVITSRLSPNAESGGFITLLADGTYRSSTSLTPILEFQRVDESGKKLGDPIVVDTAVTPIPGFPFYLASNGGKWVSTPPAGRFTNDMTSNFFYNNGSVNNFIHSNGIGPGGLGKCAKATAMIH